MRSFRHWTPRYIKNRLSVMIYQKLNSDHPWLTQQAIQILKGLLKSTDIGLEFGSGRSTLWFAKRVEHLTSVEHDEIWYGKVLGMLRRNELLSKVDYHLFPGKETLTLKNPEYVGVINRFKNNSMDFALIDGIYRDCCALNVLKKIKPGGILIIDNVNWFLPVEGHSPNSRRSIDELEPNWKTIRGKLRNWRKIWTSNGVWDTGIFFKPCGDHH